MSVVQIRPWAPLKIKDLSDTYGKKRPFGAVFAANNRPSVTRRNLPLSESVRFCLWQICGKNFFLISGIWGFRILYRSRFMPCSACRPPSPRATDGSRRSRHANGQTTVPTLFAIQMCIHWVHSRPYERCRPTHKSPAGPARAVSESLPGARQACRTGPSRVYAAVRGPEW